MIKKNYFVIFLYYLQEDSVKMGKFTSAGMYFLKFPVYHFNPTTSSVKKNFLQTFFHPF